MIPVPDKECPYEYYSRILISSDTQKGHYKLIYRIRPNYRTYPYKRTVKQCRSRQVKASVVFVYFFIKAYVVGAIQMNPHYTCFYEENQKKCINIIKQVLFPWKCTLSR